MLKKYSLITAAMVLLAGAAFSQTQTYTAFVNAAPTVSTPLGASDYVPVTQSGVTKKLAGNALVTKTDTQTLTGKSMSGSANNFSAIPLSAFTLLGTSTTVLHGNASGSPTFGAVSMTADVSGILPGANGGTANGFMAFSGPASTLKTFTLPNATATILTTNAAVTVPQGGTGAATITGLVLGNGASAMSAYAGTSCTNQFPRSLSAAGAATCASVSLTGDITGTLVVGNGGTGAATLASNGVLYGSGTSPIAALAVNSTATNKYLRQVSSGAPSWQQVPFTDISGSVAAAQLPLPGSASLGGVFSKASVSHNFLTSISSADGSVGQAQPAFSDISGTIATGQVSGAYTGITQVGTLTAGQIGSGFTAIANSALANSAVTIGSTSVSLGATASTIAGLTLTAPTLTTPILGVATATSIGIGGAAGGYPFNVSGSAGDSKIALTDTQASGKTWFWSSGYSALGTVDLVLAGVGSYFTMTSTGALQLPFYGSGAATFDASGHITSVSDERLKNIRGHFSPTLEMLRKINPIIYRYNAKSGLDQKNDYAGFGALNVRSSFGAKYADLVTGRTKDGFFTLQDRALLAGAYVYAQQLDAGWQAQDARIKSLENLARGLKTENTLLRSMQAQTDRRLRGLEQIIAKLPPANDNRLLRTASRNNHLMTP